MGHQEVLKILVDLEKAMVDNNLLDDISNRHLQGLKKNIYKNIDKELKK